MLGKRLRHCKDAAARPQSGWPRTRGERVIKPSEADGGDRAVPSRQGLERYIELRPQTQPASDADKLDDLGTHR